MKLLILGLWAVVGLTVAMAEVEMPAVFASGMVLQQGSPVPVWGWANEGERVVVRFRGQEKSALTKNGQWKVVLDPLVAGGPDSMEIEGYEALVIKDVLVGEVWLASGQSNMEWPVSKTSHAEESLATANNPIMRVFQVEDWSKDTVQEDVTGTWLPSTPEAMAGISAVAYLFGQEIQQTQKVPVGVLLSAKGGTRAVNWTSQEVLDLNPEAESHHANYNKRIASYPGEFALYTASGRTLKRPQSPTRRLPSGYFNGMINGLIPYGMRGVIWYQGETDSWNAEEYVRMFPDLIVDWRTRWNRGDFPFYYVQIASFNGKEGVEINYPHLRDVQLKTLDKLPNLGMAVAIDAGEELDIHPKDKRAVAHRLALLARNRTYGEEIVDAGPVVCGIAFSGMEARVSFNKSVEGLVVKGTALKGFELASGAGPFYPAKAVIEGDSVIVTSKDVPEPSELRYAFHGFPNSTLYNTAGLPASPFRTDSRSRADDAAIGSPE